MPPRPNPLEEPDFQLDNCRSFWTTAIWNNVTGNRPHKTIAELLFTLRPDQRDNTWRFLNFLLSAHDIAESSPATEWIPKRPLFIGNSSVGLWLKQDASQNVIDEIAIKEQNITEEILNFDPDKRFRTGLDVEAVLQVDLQQKERAGIAQEAPQMAKSTNILHLRQYKFQSITQQIRLYSLYAPYGNMDDLVTKYRMFGRKLPEPFLWLVLHSLARACLVLDGPLLEEAAIYKTHHHTRGAADFFLHTDIKDLNMVLDYAPLENDRLEGMYHKREDVLKDLTDFTDIYPVIKLADFGLVSADTGGIQEPAYCTPYWQPPELNMFGWLFKTSPNDPNMRFDSRYEVWGIAKIVWDAAMGYDEDRTVNAMRQCSEADYIARGEHFLEPTEGLGNTGYSDELMMLLRNCLTPSAAKRTSLSSLHAITRDWLRKCNTGLAWQPLKWVDRFRLYFRDNEIEDLGPGDYRGIPETAYREFKKYKYYDPQNLLNIPDVPRTRLKSHEKKMAAEKILLRPERVKFHDRHISFAASSGADDRGGDGGGSDSGAGPGRAAASPARPSFSPLTPTAPLPAVQAPAAQVHAVQPPAAQPPAIQAPAVQAPAVQNPAVQVPAVQPPAAQAPAASSPDEETLYNQWLKKAWTDIKKEVKRRDQAKKVTGKGVTKIHLARWLAIDDRNKRKRQG